MNKNVGKLLKEFSKYTKTKYEDCFKCYGEGVINYNNRYAICKNCKGDGVIKVKSVIDKGEKK